MLGHADLADGKGLQRPGLKQFLAQCEFNPWQRDFSGLSLVGTKVWVMTSSRMSSSRLFLGVVSNHVCEDCVFMAILTTVVERIGKKLLAQTVPGQALVRSALCIYTVCIYALFYSSWSTWLCVS